MREGGIVISIPTLGMLDVEIVSSLCGLERPPNTAIEHFWPVRYTVDKARDLSAETAIAEQAEYLFFIDHDVILPTKALLRLVARDADIASGLYFTRSKPPFPLVFVDGHPTMDWTPGDVVQVDAVGMGCTLIRRELFEQLEPPWFVTTGQGTEDTHFCRRLREELGIRPVVDTGISCVHKDLATGDRFYLDRETALPMWMDSRGTTHCLPPVAHDACCVVDLTKEDKSEEADCRASGDAVAG